jgi:hypothetical protein
MVPHPTGLDLDAECESQRSGAAPLMRGPAEWILPVVGGVTGVVAGVVVG